MTLHRCFAVDAAQISNGLSVTPQLTFSSRIQAVHIKPQGDLYRMCGKPKALNGQK